MAPAAPRGEMQGRSGGGPAEMSSGDAGEVQAGLRARFRAALAALRRSRVSAEKNQFLANFNPRSKRAGVGRIP